MLSFLLNPFRSDLAVYVSGERILIGTNTELLANQSTCVAIHKNTRRILAVGDEALLMKGKEPPNIQVVQPYKNGCIQDFDIAEAAFRYLFKKYSPRKLIPPRVVVSGQIISETAKRSMKMALTQAGAREVMLLECPMAAAIGIGLAVEEPSFQVVMNFESDWMDIATISLAGVAARTSEPIGFSNLLQDITIYSTEALGASPDRTHLEAALRSNGFGRDCEFIGWEAWIDSLENGRELSGHLTADLMSKACTPTLLRIREAYKSMLEQLPKERRMLVNNAPVHLTGDYSNIPGISELLGRRLQRTVKVSAKSTEAAYYGTATILTELNDLIPYVAAKNK